MFEMLHKKGVAIEQKPISVGMRIEHPAETINLLRYGDKYDELKQQGAANYSFTYNNRKTKRGVCSFCMCPGGWIVPAATENDEVVDNGMSLSRRDSPFANSGLVCAVEPLDLQSLVKQHGVLAGLVFQKQLEQAAKTAGGGQAPRSDRATREREAGPGPFQQGRLQE